MNAAKLKADSTTHLPESAVHSATVDLSATDYTFTEPTRALHIGVGGDIDVVFASGSRALLKNVSDGDLRPYAVKMIIRATTTATNIVGLF